jgi:hypothetical protein
MKGRIKYVREIQVIKDGSGPELLAIKARGVAEIKMVIAPVLIPRKYEKEPEDGIYELDFAFDESADEFTSVEFEVEVILPVDKLPDWVKGIRINASENSDIELL